jgi:TPP-dependent pyruvate/acetoin dehydrogenase alpha subunit
MTIYHRKLANVIVFVDANGFQSDSRCSEIKAIADPLRVFEGFGFQCLEVDGHHLEAIQEAWELARSTSSQPTVIFAHTHKTGGTKLLPPVKHEESGLLSQPWHTKVPVWDLYIRLLDEQCSLLTEAAECEAIREAWSRHKKQVFSGGRVERLKNTLRPSYGAYLGTGILRPSGRC